MAPKTNVIPSEFEQNEEAWFTSRWRPAMAWQYLFVCLFDFVFAPVLLGLYSYYSGEYHAWEPLTIRGGAIYHLSMGAVVGVAVWSRGKEKMALLNSGEGTDAVESAAEPRVSDRAN